MAEKDGGPAFPHLPAFESVDGMSLRDYLAAKAMGHVHNYRPADLLEWLRWALGMHWKSSMVNHEDLSRQAYKLADFMLAERDK